MTSLLPEYNYSVTASWKYKDDDPVAFCNTAKQYIEYDYIKHNPNMRNFAKLNHITFSTPFEYFKFVCPNAYMDGELMRANYIIYDLLYYDHDYDKWMRKYFRLTMSFLADGSRMDVSYVDQRFGGEGDYLLIVENGEVKEIHKEVETF